MLAAPIRAIFFAVGLHDLRCLFILSLLALLGLIRIYAHLGFFN